MAISPYNKVRVHTTQRKRATCHCPEAITNNCENDTSMLLLRMEKADESYKKEPQCGGGVIRQTPDSTRVCRSLSILCIDVVPTTVSFCIETL